MVDYSLDWIINGDLVSVNFFLIKNNNLFFNRENNFSIHILVKSLEDTAIPHTRLVRAILQISRNQI